jgi:hypothetical protein
MKKTTLTEAEEAEFRPVNAVAFDLKRAESKEMGQIPACWLCMSDEAKEAARQRLYEMLSRKIFCPIKTEADWLRFIPDNWGGPEVARWREAELTFKQLREEGNPRAFFVE